MNSLTNIGFKTIPNTLLPAPQADTDLLQEALEKKQAYENELNPHSPTAHLLSSRRREKLKKEICEIDNFIQSKLNPIPSKEIFNSQTDSMRQLMLKLPSQTPNEFHQALKKLHPDVKAKIYRIVAIVSNFPKKEAWRSELLLKKDTSILKSNFPPLLGGQGGTLLDQVLEDIAFDFQLTHGLDNSIQIRDEKVQFFMKCLKDLNRTHTHMNALFRIMHPCVQEELRTQGIDLPFYGRGFNVNAHHTLGAHYDGFQNATAFRVYAPNATHIELHLTAWGYSEHVMQMVKQENGIWEWKVWDGVAKPGRTYFFMVTDNAGKKVKKVDPFAFGNFIRDLDGNREDHESVVFDVDKEFAWNDDQWMKTIRPKRNPAKDSLNIYEIHSPSWMLSNWKLNEHGAKVLNWRDLAPKLSEYCKINGYNAVELMAMFSHPQPISMGYQITNFFAPESEMGTWEDFQYFVNYMHNVKLNNGQMGISVFADWVPAHFALDSFALTNFDGTPLLEDDNPTYANHPAWGTRVFDFKKQFTKDFLASNADFILKKLHIDGLRVDAVSSILKFNWYRPESEWRTNKAFGDIDLDAKVFFRNITTYLHNTYPGAILIAEDSSAFPNLTRKVHKRGMQANNGRGIGFDMTWHMGFTNDTLTYWEKPAHQRRGAFSDFVNTVKDVDGGSDNRPRGHTVIPYSHDETANGKKSILTKMPGNSRLEMFANGRLSLAYQLLRGGGPTLDFMGNELLQSSEWHRYIQEKALDNSRPLRPTVQWEELDPGINSGEYQLHSGAQASRRDLNHLYHDNPGLWDQTDDGFSWLHTDPVNCVLSFHRRGSGQQFACIFNTADTALKDYEIPFPNGAYAPELIKLVGVDEVYSTDHVNYGGEGRLTFVQILSKNKIEPTHFRLNLPPYTAVVLKEKFIV